MLPLLLPGTCTHALMLRHIQHMICTVEAFTRSWLCCALTSHTQLLGRNVYILPNLHSSLQHPTVTNPPCDGPFLPLHFNTSSHIDKPSLRRSIQSYALHYSIPQRQSLLQTVLPNLCTLLQHLIVTDSSRGNQSLFESLLICALQSIFWHVWVCRVSQLLHWAPSPIYPSRGSGFSLMQLILGGRREERRLSLYITKFGWRFFSTAVILNICSIVALFCVYMCILFIYPWVCVSVHVHAYACLQSSEDNFHKLVLSS